MTFGASCMGKNGMGHALALTPALSSLREREKSVRYVYQDAHECARYSDGERQGRQVCRPAKLQLV
ncbi:hypothetical protein NH00_13615 [Enterobacter cancerogenus]|nr:hypothetical protein NH00_13615 [Enterobacter cancerogenus]